MGPDAPPKCLLKVRGRSLLRRTLEALRSVGIDQLVIVVGFKKEEVAAHVRGCAGLIRVTLLENPRYSEGAILSLWCARAHFDDDLLIMDADVLSPPLFLERLVRSVKRNCLLVDGSCVGTGEEQIVLGRGDRVLAITKRPSQELRSRMTSFGESVGFLKLSSRAAGLLRELLERKVAGGIVQIEHEQLYPELFEREQVGFERVDGLPWIEIDTPEDLRRAEEEILPRWEPPLCLNRLIARRFFPMILRIPVTPNQWTFFSLLLGMAAVGCVAQGSASLGLAGALLFEFFYMVDNWDGEVARAKGLSSRWGGWFDVMVDALVQVGLALALAAGILRRGAPPWILQVGWVAAGGLFLDFLVTLWAKARGFGPAIFGDPSRGVRVAADSRVARWIRANLTHENFSLLVVLILLLDWREPFLWALAVGSQFFWLSYLWRERLRLFYNLAQARR